MTFTIIYRGNVLLYKKFIFSFPPVALSSFPQQQYRKIQKKGLKSHRVRCLITLWYFKSLLLNPPTGRETIVGISLFDPPHPHTFYTCRVQISMLVSSTEKISIKLRTRKFLLLSTPLGNQYIAYKTDGAPLRAAHHSKALRMENKPVNWFRGFCENWGLKRKRYVDFVVVDSFSQQFFTWKVTRRLVTFQVKTKKKSEQKCVMYSRIALLDISYSIIYNNNKYYFF